MSILTRFFPSVLNSLSRFSVCSANTFQPSYFHSLTNEGLTAINPGGVFSIPIRTNIRIHFPRPSERKRIRRHGFKARMSTPEGRRVIMNRILKGRHVYTH